LIPGVEFFFFVFWVAGSVGAAAAFLSLCVSWGRRQARADSFRSVKPDAFMEALNSTYTVSSFIFRGRFQICWKRWEIAGRNKWAMMILFLAD
jgi:hypothetical protein